MNNAINTHKFNECCSYRWYFGCVRAWNAFYVIAIQCVTFGFGCLLCILVVGEPSGVH